MSDDDLAELLTILSVLNSDEIIVRQMFLRLETAKFSREFGALVALKTILDVPKSSILSRIQKHLARNLL